MATATNRTNRGEEVGVQSTPHSNDTVAEVAEDAISERPADPFVGRDPDLRGAIEKLWPRLEAGMEYLKDR